MKKNNAFSIQQAHIEGIGHHLDDKGNGVVKTKHGEFIVPHVLPHDKVDIVLPSSSRQKKKKQALLDKTFYTPWKRIMPFCSHSGVCGGCSFQHLSYADQLAIKDAQVSYLLSEYIDETCLQYPILPSKDTFYYRNRVDYTFGALRWLYEKEQAQEVLDRRGFGFHVKGMYDKVVHLNHCFLHKSNELRVTVHEWALENNVSYYNSRTQEGLLRLMTVRITLKGEMMVILLSSSSDDIMTDLCDVIIKKHPEVTSLYTIVNESTNDNIQGDSTLMSGASCIHEKCGHLTLKIYPHVFYQTNSKQAEILYEKILEYADVRADSVLLDLYCGIGGIGLYCANKVKYVVGVDSVPESIVAAQENATYNNIDNAYFFSFLSEEAVNYSVENMVSDVPHKELFVHAMQKADVVIVDPPRAGLHKNVVKYLCSIHPRVLIYIACNPYSLKRDLEHLCKKYKVVTKQVIDMFPHTHHIEAIVKLIPR